MVEWTQSKDKQHRQADDLVLGTLQNGVLDLGKREVAQGWQAVKTQAQALKENTAALGGKGVLEGLELKLDATANKLTVQAGKALRADGQLLQLGAAQDLKLPSDSRGYRVVLRHEAQSGSTKAQLEQSPQADDLVLGQLLRDPQDAAKHVLDLAKREVARGWPSLTSAPFGVKSPLLTLNAGESSSSISTPTANVPHIKRTKTPYTAPFSARYHHRCAVFAPAGSAPRLWVIGGEGLGSQNDVWSTADGITWQEHKGQGVRFSPRYAHQVVVFQNKLWVLGGFAHNGFSDEVWYSDNGKDWTQHSASYRFSARHVHQCVVFKAQGDSAEKLWVIGGNTNTSGVNNDVWSFDGNSWVNHGNRNFTARHTHQVLAFGGKLWLIGGYANNSSYNNDVYWSEDGINWSKPYTAAFSPRQIHQALVYDNKMWVIGGNTKNGKTGDVWSTRDGINWQREAWAAAFSPRSSHQAVVFNNKMWVIGGDTDNGHVADVWSSTDGVDWHNYALKEERVTKEKRVAGLRVERGSAGQSVLAYAEESGQWEIDGRGIATNEAEVQDALSLNKAKLDALRAQLLGEINKAKTEAAQGVQQAKQDALNAAVPVGFIYVQFPKHKSPQQIWGGKEVSAPDNTLPANTMQWKNVSNNYAGCFFRAEGKGYQADTAQNFKSQSNPQLDAGRNVYGSFGAFSDHGKHAVQTIGGSNGTNYAKAGYLWRTIDINASRNWGSPHTKNEFRPVNYTVKVWERLR